MESFFSRWKNYKNWLRTIAVQIVKRIRAKTTLSTSICYYPTFSSIEDLTNHYHRAAWYLPLVPNLCEQVLFYQKFDPNSCLPGPRPDYMAPPPHDFSHAKIRRWGVSFFFYLLRARAILIWKHMDSDPWIRWAKFLAIETVHLDTENPSAQEYGKYTSLLWDLSGTFQKNSIIKENQLRFLDLAEELVLKDYQGACVFGTGPSLELAAEYDFTHYLNIVCNSIVKNPALLDHIQPRFLTAGDALSHFGVSQYAHQFRNDLLATLKKDPNITFVTTACFGFLLLRHYPEIRDRTILIEQTVNAPNFDLKNNFGLPILDSTLNIHMIPLAATFARNIFLLGVDGKKSSGDNEDFWPHSKTSQYHDLVDTGHQCHPTFDENRQKDTYNRYLASVRETIASGELEKGIDFWVLGSSNIPEFERRKVRLHSKLKKNLQGMIGLEDLAETFGLLCKNNRESLSPGRTEKLANPSLSLRFGLSQCYLEDDDYLVIKGWVLTSTSLDQLMLWGNEIYLGNPFYFPYRRPDVFNNYPEYENKNSGFLFGLRLGQSKINSMQFKIEGYSGGNLIFAKQWTGQRPN